MLERCDTCSLTLAGIQSLRSLPFGGLHIIPRCLLHMVRTLLSAPTSELWHGRCNPPKECCNGAEAASIAGLFLLSAVYL